MSFRRCKDLSLLSQPLREKLDNVSPCTGYTQNRSSRKQIQSRRKRVRDDQILSHDRPKLLEHPCYPFLSNTPKPIGEKMTTKTHSRTCLCPPPGSATWHCAHFVLKIFAPMSTKVKERERQYVSKTSSHA